MTHDIAAADGTGLRRRIGFWLLTLYGVGVVAVVVMWILIQYQSAVGGLTLVSGVALPAYALHEAFHPVNQPP